VLLEFRQHVSPYILRYLEAAEVVATTRRLGGGHAFGVRRQICFGIGLGRRL
jgi:hypothetical protein